MASPVDCSYDLFVRREGRRWRWTVLCLDGDGASLLADYTGTTWTESGADRQAREAVRKDALGRR